jgi:hypothetical protein
MASSPPLKPPKTELDYQLSFRKWDTLAEWGNKLIQWSAVVVIAYFGFRTFDALAGRNTFAEFGIKVLGNITVNRAILSFVTASGWVFGLGQRNLRRRNIERLSREKNELERRLDPKRTSSNLTKKGTTPKKGR